jgi:hypothetical protein
MADNTQVSAPGTGADVLRTEDIGGGIKLAVSKIYLGAHGADNGPVTTSNPFPVTGPSGPIDGVDITSPSPAMPSGGAGIRGWLSAIWTKLNATIAVSGTFWQATQPVSAAALPLPTGAATSANQCAPGTAGAPSANVQSVQGVASMTPLKVDGSGATQPVSGSVSVSNFPGTQAVSGSVSVSNLPGTQPVSGSVSVSNFPGTQPVSGTVSVGNFPSTQTVVLSDAAATTGSITALDSGTATVTNADGQSITSGTPTAGSSVRATISGATTARIEVTAHSGSLFNGTILFERSVDGSIFEGTTATEPGGASAPVSSDAFTGVASTRFYTVDVAGFTGVGARCSAFTSGQLDVRIQPGSGPVHVALPGGAPPIRGTMTDHSGTIATGGSAQQAVAANPNRNFLLVANPPNATGNLWVNFTTTATQAEPSIGLQPGQGLTLSKWVSTEAVSVIASDTSHPFVCKDG